MTLPVTAIVQSLTCSDDTNPDCGGVDDQSTESWAFLVVMWLDFLSDLAVAFALFQRPTLRPLIDTFTTKTKEEQDRSRQLLVKGIGVHFDTEDTLVDVFQCFGVVNDAKIHHQMDKDGVTNTSWPL